MTTKTISELIAGPVSTTDSNLVVQMANDAKLPVGGHHFELKVEDDSGNVSQPARIMVIVIDDQAPAAVLSLRGEDGRPVQGNQIPYGQGFILDGKRSVDLGGGKIVKYIWSLVD